MTPSAFPASLTVARLPFKICHWICEQSRHECRYVFNPCCQVLCKLFSVEICNSLFLPSSTRQRLPPGCNVSFRRFAIVLDLVCGRVSKINCRSPQVAVSTSCLQPAGHDHQLRTVAPPRRFSLCLRWQSRRQPFHLS